MPIKREELHKMKDAEIVEELQRQRTRLYEIKSVAVTEKLENPHELGNIRKDIARLLTEQNARLQAKTEEAA